jgi:hypothetical protein
MKANTPTLIFLTILFYLTIFPISVSAFSYRADLNNGSWSQYTPDLASSFYAPDSQQSAYNRDFETDFNLTLTNPPTSPLCDDYWCIWSPYPANSNQGRFVRSSDANQGNYSANFFKDILGETYVWQKNELAIDANVSFYYKSLIEWKAGYFNSSADLNDVYFFTVFDSFVSADWKYVSYVLPTGNIKWGFKLGHGGEPQGNLFIDNIVITRNNAGTFFKGYSAPNCSSIFSCSNITDANKIGSNSTRDLYWIADYVSGATCSISENGVSSGNMVEMSGGMYYYKISHKAYPSAYVDVNLSATCAKTPYATKSFFVSPRIYNDSNIQTTMTTSNSLTGNIGYRGDIVTFLSLYLDDVGEPITNANCTLTIDGGTNAMTYNSSLEKYEYVKGFVADGTYPVTHSCSLGNYETKTTNYSVIIGNIATETLIISPIENISSVLLGFASNDVTISPTNNENKIIFSAENKSSGNYVVAYHVTNSLIDNRQYFVFTSSNGSDWAINDTINFSPIQKIPVSGGYLYSFNDTLLHNETKYYKLVYSQMPLAWGTIASQDYWANVNQPTEFTDENAHTWDLFQDSNYTSIQSYTTKYFGELVSSTLTTGYELQFTAYASTPMTLLAGYRANGTDNVLASSITTQPTRFSVPINPNDFYSQIIFESVGATSARVYITDYAIVPRSYFVERLEILNEDGTIPQAIISGGTSVQYIQEGYKFRAIVKAWDINADLYRLRVEALLGGTIVKTFETKLSDLTSEGAILTLDNLYDGIIDFNGNASSPIPFRDLTVKATLINNSGDTVAEQYKAIKLLQYPYFGDDITFSAQSLNNKVGANPSFRITINQVLPEMLIGLQIRIYDSNHSFTTPNYQDTTFSADLACGATCQKTITATDFVYSAETNYRVAFIFLLKTENVAFGSAQITRIYNVPVSYRNFETQRMFQVFERQDFQYHNSEAIPLVLQMRDVPYQNMRASYDVYLTISECTAATGANCTAQTTKFYPQKFVYDEATGYNYWYFNNYFYKDNGNPIGDGNFIRFTNVVTNLVGSNASTNTPTLIAKCKDANYSASLFNPLGFLMNYWADQFSGCGDPTKVPELISVLGDAEEKRIDVNNSRVITGGENQSLICIKTDTNTTYTINGLAQTLNCIVIYRVGERQIDQFDFLLGNNYSDYSKTGTTAQYIKVSVPAIDVIFNDPYLMKQALAADYQTTTNTLGEFAQQAFSKAFAGFANPLTRAITNANIAAGNVNIITNVGADINWDGAFDPTIVSGVFLLQINGFTVTNQNDYLKDHAELATLDPTYFRQWAKDNNVTIPLKNTTIQVIANDFKVIERFSVPSPIVINELPSQTSSTTSTDANGTITAGIPIPAKLNFKLTSDMISGNYAYVSRVYLPLTFSYVVPDGSANPILQGAADFIFHNWIWLLLGFVTILGVSLVARNFGLLGAGRG